MAQQAQETFVAELDTGPQLVVKGTVFGDAHPLVGLDAGRNVLFKPLDVDEAAPAARRARPSRAKPKGAAAAAAEGGGDGDGG